MLPDSDLKKGKEVRVTDTGKHDGKTGKISFFEEKHGYKQSYVYFDVTVKFEDNDEGVFKSWNLVATDYVAEKDEPVIETPVVPEVKKRKTRQAAKRFNLTNTLIEDNILIVQTGLIHNTFEENTMSDTNAAVALTDTTADTTVTATPVVKTPQKRGRKPDPNSKINRAAAFLAALPAEQLTKAIAVPLLMKELDLTEEVAQVYFYNKRPASARKVRTPKAAKVTAPTDTTTATDDTTVDTTEVTSEDTTSAE